MFDLSLKSGSVSLESVNVLYLFLTLLFRDGIEKRKKRTPIKNQSSNATFYNGFQRLIISVDIKKMAFTTIIIIIESRSNHNFASTVYVMDYWLICDILFCFTT